MSQIHKKGMTLILNTDPSSEWEWQLMSAVGTAADAILTVMQRMPLLFEL